MQLLYSFRSVLLIALTCVVVLTPKAQAHLMQAQHGTLNFLEDDAFMVLSLPISAFTGLDDNNDQQISMLEFNRHRAEIIATLKKNITLKASKKSSLLQAIMLSPVTHHHDVHEPITQLIIMGKFTQVSIDKSLHFSLNLYGQKNSEQTLKMTATHKKTNQKNTFELSPENAISLLF